jgi:tight adherence protein B
MQWIILILFMLTSFLFFVHIFQSLLLSDKKMKKRMKQYLDLNNKRKLNWKKFNILLQFRLYKHGLREKLVAGKKNEELEKTLSQAGISLRAEEFVMARWIIAALGAGVFYLITDQVMMMAAGLVLGIIGPKWWIRKKQRDRLDKFNEGLADMLTTIIGSLRAGFSFVQALKTVAEEAESPIKEETEVVLKEMQYGITVERALQQLKERMPSEDLELIIQAVLIQKQVGGNLATVLETIVQTIRDRNNIHRKIQTLTAQGRLSGVVIGSLPVVLGLVIYLMQPEYMGSFFTHPVGIAMIIGGSISGLIGFMLIKKITTIEV